MTSRALLVYLPGFEIGYGPIFPLGIGYLLSSIKQDRPTKAVHYQIMDHAIEQLPEVISKFHPDIIGLTCSSFNRGNAKRISKWIKQTYPSIKIIIGGVHASFFPGHMLNYYDADYVVIGEGERTFRELCNAIDDKSDLSKVDGIVYKEGDDKIIVTYSRKVIADLDSILTPDFSYASDIMTKSGLGFVITSRGCPAHCNFCSTSSYWGQKVRVHSASRVGDEIEAMISNYGAKKILFHDDTFNISINRANEICDEIFARNLKIEWSAVCRVHPASQEMIDKMVEAGCRHICWGIESGSSSMLESINKKINQAQIKNAYEFCRKHIGRISVGAFTMVGNQGESDKTIKESIDFLNTLPMTDSPAPSVLYVLPGTKVYNDMKQKNPSIDDFWIESGDVLRPPEYSLVQLVDWAKKIGGSGNIQPFDRSKHFLNNLVFGNIPPMEKPPMEISTVKSEFDTPVLFLVFNRPKLTQIVFDEIRKLKPSQLFIAADGPRKGIIGDIEKCCKVREIISKVDWDCDCRYLIQDKNLGGKWGGYTGIDWFFNNVEQGIIIEDDDLPDPSFFKYCQELLSFYKDNPKIATISGDNFQFGNNKTPDSYYFSKYLHGWGWATWKRAWKDFDITIKDWPQTKGTNWIGEYLDDPREVAFWTSTLDRMYAGDMGAWDYQFSYNSWKKKMLNIIPNNNLICNIGWDEDSTHCINENHNPMAKQKAAPMEFPLKHPSAIERNVAADIYTLRFYL